jgi:hypothetical protein
MVRILSPDRSTSTVILRASQGPVICAALGLLATYALAAGNESPHKKPPTEVNIVSMPPATLAQPAEVKVTSMPAVPTPQVNVTLPADESARHLVWLTGGLVVATVLQFGALLWQGCQIRRQITLARDEFIASHRPRFDIREPYLATIHCPADPPENIAYQARFVLANYGESNGTPPVATQNPPPVATSKSPT